MSKWELLAVACVPTGNKLFEYDWVACGDTGNGKGQPALQFSKKNQ